jgi:hypothetical protein
MVVGGFGAPAFLFLAGVAMPLAIGRGCERASTPRGAAARARRGWQVFGLAFLFRFQSWVISRGAALTLLKVDILNILGCPMLAAAVLWGLARTRARASRSSSRRPPPLAAIAPAIRASTAIAAGPIRSSGTSSPWTGKSSFTLSPWPAFLFAGVAVGEWLEGARTAPGAARHVAAGRDRRALVATGYAATFFPPVYDNNALWTSRRRSSACARHPADGAAGGAVRGRARRGSLGARRVRRVVALRLLDPRGDGLRDLSMSLHRRLTVPQAAVGYVLLCVLPVALVRLKNRITGGLKTASTYAQFSASNIRLIFRIRLRFVPVGGTNARSSRSCESV